MPAAGPYALASGTAVAHDADCPDAATSLPTEQPTVILVVTDRVARLRLFAGALGFAYLSLWTLASQRGLLPPHVPVVDLLLLVAAVIAARALACRAMLLLPAAAYVHVVAQLGLIPGPQSRLQWGITCVAGGFALLVLSLFATAWLHRRPGQTVA